MIDKIKCKIINFIDLPFFKNYIVIFSFWVLLGLISALLKIGSEHKMNNFLIFRGVFTHLIEQLPLYIEYPSEYFDQNYYGPIFSVLIAPFALIPPKLGIIFWHIALSIFMFFAVKDLPLSRIKKVIIYWLISHELLTALFMSQFNIAIAAIIILSFTCIEKEKDFWAAFLIILGTFVKLYGIVGLAFFFFSKHKVKFIISLAFWALILFVLPMFFTSPQYIIGQYSDWFTALTSKNDSNMFATHQNISFLGIVRKISHCTQYSDLYLIFPGLLLFSLAYLRVNQFKYLSYRLTILASVLIFTVIFSTSSESSGYIIAFSGVAIWYFSIPNEPKKLDLILLIFAFILTSMSPSDLFPLYLRKEFVQPYALKALPCVLIWFRLVSQMVFKDYYLANFKKNK